MIDIFRSDAFSLRTLTSAINDLPHVPTRIGDMGLFDQQGINTVTAQLEKRNNALYLVQSQPRGGDANKNEQEGRTLIPLNAVHLPITDRLNADEVQGVRAFGSDNQLESIEMKRTEKLATMNRSMEATLEWHRIGAVKGIVLDADASVLYNLYDVFGITKIDTFQFRLTKDDPASGQIRMVCHAIARAIEDELGAVQYTGIVGMCGSVFMDRLVSHPETLKAYDRWNEGQALRERFARRTFAYAGILFEEYRGKVGNTKFIDDDACEFFPVGVPDLFKCVYAPANFMATVNTIGLPTYAKGTPDPKDRWLDIDVQSNPLHYCTRPRVLVKGVAGS